MAVKPFDAPFDYPVVGALRMSITCLIKCPRENIRPPNSFTPQSFVDKVRKSNVTDCRLLSFPSFRLQRDS